MESNGMESMESNFPIFLWCIEVEHRPEVCSSKMFLVGKLLH